MKNILFLSTVFLVFLDCIQFLRVLSNLELERLFTIFLLFIVCSCFVFRAIIGQLFFCNKYTKHMTKRRATF